MQPGASNAKQLKPTGGTEWPGERMLPRAWTRYVLGRLKRLTGQALRVDLEQYH
jgi:hypothetical protein